MLLKEVDRDKYFHVANGMVIRAVWELEPALQSMGDETLRYHVNSEKNDFARWVADVLDDKELAAQLAELTDKQEMRIGVLRRLVKVLKDDA